MSSDAAIVARALEALDGAWEDEVRLLSEMVRIPSVVGREREVQRWARHRMEELELAVREVSLPDEELLAVPGTFDPGIDGEGRPNVVGLWPGDGEGRSLALNAHVDVVDPGPREAWSRDPWSGEREDGWLHGRGAVDMKGGWIAIHAALRALREAGYRPPADLRFDSVVEEEAGGVHGALACLLALPRPDGMVITEPLWSHVVVGHPGILYFRVRVPGRSVHAALAQHGVSALHEAMPIVAALRDLDEHRARRHRHPLFERLPGCEGRSVHLVVGRFRAGEWPSTVPGEAILEARLSWLPDETEEEVRREVTRTVRTAAEASAWLREHPPRVEWFGWRGQPWLQDPGHPLVELLRDAVAAERGDRPDVAADTAGLDARWAGQLGVPCAVFGPDGEGIHGANERVDLASVRTVARALVRFIVSWQSLR